MIGLALSGGGSRAIAFHLGCLRALYDRGILEKVSVLSTISGGSVIGALYAYHPEWSFENFDLFTQEILRSGFNRAIVSRLLQPRLLLSCIATNIVCRIGNMAKRPEARMRRVVSRTDAFECALRDMVYFERTLTSPTKNNLEIIIGACELSTGTTFRFGNESSGGSHWGQVKDNCLPVSLAVAASAAYPLLLPALDREFILVKKGYQERKRVILTDGGVYDNLGISCLSPHRSSAISTHAMRPAYLIACNASPGRELAKPIPWSIISRVSRAFKVIHRRVQDSTMHELHHWKEAGMIKGFILPYLGQDDRKLPFQLPGMVLKSDVEAYPTDFNPMSKQWIEKLSLRGEQLTRILLQQYMSQL